MIASGSWKARKHKALAAEAHAAWTDLRKHTNNQLWIRHVRGHSRHRWNNRADSLANQIVGWVAKNIMSYRHRDGNTVMGRGLGLAGGGKG